MFDPPRDDTADMIAMTEGLGVHVKMITGDHLTIAKETAKLLGMGNNIFPAAYMKDEAKARNETGLGLYEIVCEADGFAEVGRTLLYQSSPQQKTNRVCVVFLPFSCF